MNVWNEYPQFTQTFNDLIDDPTLLSVDSEHMKQIEHFISLLFCKKSTESSINATRRRLFTVGLKTWDNIHPSQHALFQHVKRALYVVCFQWKVSLTKNPDYVDPKEWGWT